ncbi:hypothetical protein D3C79_717340 [compost metagenome]
MLQGAGLCGVATGPADHPWDESDRRIGGKLMGVLDTLAPGHRIFSAERADDLSRKEQLLKLTDGLGYVVDGPQGVHPRQFQCAKPIVVLQKLDSGLEWRIGLQYQTGGLERVNANDVTLAVVADGLQIAYIVGRDPVEEQATAFRAAQLPQDVATAFVAHLTQKLPFATLVFNPQRVGVMLENLHCLKFVIDQFQGVADGVSLCVYRESLTR